MKLFVKRKKRGEVKFNPNSIYIGEAVNNYLINGGKITRIEMDDDSFNSFMNGTEPPSSVDEFLLE